MITDKSLSWMIFIQRVLFAAAIAFLAAGEMLHINAFVQNAIDIGMPLARVLSTAVVVISFISAGCILLGLFFRTACAGAVVAVLYSGFFFFAGNINKVNMIGVLFALTILCGFLFAGSGRISLDYYFRQKRIRDNKRITFR